MASEIVITAFTNNGINLALKLAKFLQGRVFIPKRLACESLYAVADCEVIDEPLGQWTGQYFHEAGPVRRGGALIFISACGIAVRAIAPHVKSKLSDPAVIVIDEAGKFVIPILSGHIGGANELARKISGFLGKNSQPVITTATDINNLPAVDEWAVNNNYVIENPNAIRKVSCQILERNSVGVAVTEQNIPTPFPVTLFLRPRNLILGVGCNRGIDSEKFERAAKNFLDGAGVSILSLKAMASIDLKAQEKALMLFAENHNIPFLTFSASELQSLPGNFTGSQKVLSITGTDNVCERSCMLAAGENAVLLRSKAIYDGITFALARENHASTKASAPTPQTGHL